MKQRSLRSKRLHSIPEVAEEESDSLDSMGQHLSFEEGGRPGTPQTQRRWYPQESHHVRDHLTPGKNIRLQRQRSSPRFTDGRYGYSADDRSYGRPNRQNTKSPDSGLDCGSEEEGSLGRGHRGYYAHGSPIRGPVRIIHCEGPVERRALAMGRKRTLTRQCSVEEEFSDAPVTADKSVHTGDFRNREHMGSGREVGPRNYSREGALSEGRLNELDRVYYSPHREARTQSLSRLNRDQPLVCESEFLLYFLSASCNLSFYFILCKLPPFLFIFFLLLFAFLFLISGRDVMFHGGSYLISCFCVNYFVCIQDVSWFWSSVFNYLKAILGLDSSCLCGKRLHLKEGLCAVHGGRAAHAFSCLPVPSLCQLPPSYVAVFVPLTRAAAIALHPLFGVLCQHLSPFIATVRGAKSRLMLPAGFNFQSIKIISS